MAKTVTVDELPTLTPEDLSHPMWLAMGDNGTPYSLVGFRNAAIAKLDELASIREAKETARSQALSANTAEAAAYAELKALADASSERIKAETDQLTAKLKQQIAGIVKSQNEKLATNKARLIEAEKAAVSASISDTVAGLDPETKVREYVQLSDQFNSLRDTITKVPDFPSAKALKAYKLPGRGSASGSTGNGAVHNGDTHPMGRPRFAYASVDGVELVKPNTDSITKACDSNSADHFKTELLTAIGGIKEAFPRYPETVTFTFNGKTVTVSQQALGKNTSHTDTDTDSDTESVSEETPDSDIENNVVSIHSVVDGVSAQFSNAE